MSNHLRLAPSPAGPETSNRGLGPAPIRVLLADDHTRVRRNLRLLLDNHEGIEVVVESSDVSDLLKQAHKHRPHVIVFDLQLEGGSTTEAIRHLRQYLRGPGIVVLTMERSAAFVQQVLDGGATGVVLKDRADTELAPAIRCTAHGEEFVSPHMAAGVDALQRSADADGLSHREMEVLRLVALGHTSTEIARLIHVSRRTVEAHRASVHRRLGLRTRAELVQLALRRGLIGTDDGQQNAAKRLIPRRA